MLPLFDNPPTSDRVEISAIQDTYKKASAKFREAAEKAKAGDNQAAVAAESEATVIQFEDFNELVEEYLVSEQACTQPQP